MDQGNDQKLGTIFLACCVIGVGIGFVVSLLADEWMYMGAGAVLGVGVGFAIRALYSK